MMLCSETDWLCHLSYWRLWQVVMASVRCVIELQQKQVAIRMSSLDAQITFVCLSVYSSLQLGCVCVCETELHLVSVEKSFIIDFSFFFSSSLSPASCSPIFTCKLVLSAFCFVCGWPQSSLSVPTALHRAFQSLFCCSKQSKGLQGWTDK